MRKIDSILKKIPLGVTSAAVYTLSTIITRGLAIITVPIFTRLMTTEQVGIVNVYNSWYALISTFATLSLTSGGFAVAMKEYPNSRDQYVGSMLSLTSLIALVLVIVYAVAPNFWQRVLGLPNGLIVLMIVGFFVAPARDFWLARQRYEYKYKLAGMISIATAVIASVASVYVVNYMRTRGEINTAEGRLYANYAIIYGVAAVIWIFLLVRGKTFYSKEYWKMSLALSIPLVGYNVAGQVLNVSDRMMISKLINNSAVGIYGTLYAVSSLSLILWQAINASFVPYLFHNIERKEHKIKEIASILMFAYAMFAVLLSYLAPEIVRILATEEYYEAIYIMPPIAAGVFFTSFANLYSNVAVYYKKTKYVMYPAIIAAAFNLVTNYIFILKYGYMAAAYTTLVAYIILAVMQAIWSSRLCQENKTNINNIFDNKKMMMIAIATTVAVLLGLLLYINNTLRYFAIGVVMLLLLFIFKKVYNCF